MQLPLEIRFRNMDPSDAVETRARELAEKLDRYYDRIISCRVIFEASHRHQYKGYIYNVKIDITVPGNEIVISREAEQDHSHEDVYVALRDAFKAAYRKLESFAQKQRGHVKAHEEAPHGRVSFLSQEEGYGRITDGTGREIYFHRNSLINGDFEKLNEGDEVRFAEGQGEKGPQASTVKLIGKHHLG